jgi:hypothetical protein
MEELFVRQRQNSDVKELDWRTARSHLVVEVFASSPNIFSPPSNTTPAVRIFSKLRLKPGMNVFGRDILLAEEPDDHSLVVLHPLSERT